MQPSKKGEESVSGTGLETHRLGIQELCWNKLAIHHD